MEHRHLEGTVLHAESKAKSVMKLNILILISRDLCVHFSEKRKPKDA